MFIRPYQAQDTAAIARIYRRAIAPVSTALGEDGSEEELFTSWLQTWLTHIGPREALLVLDQGGKAIGWGGLRQWCDRPGYHLSGELLLFLPPLVIEQGSGHRLQQSLLHRAKQLNYHHILARILAHQRGSLELHKQAGFRVVGIQKEILWHQGQWQDVVLLQRQL